MRIRPHAALSALLSLALLCEISPAEPVPAAAIATRATFMLRIREGTKLSKPLQEALKELQDSGQIIIQKVKQSGEILSKKL